MMKTICRLISISTPLLLLLLVGTGRGQQEADPESMSPEQVRAEIQRINAEIKSLKDSTDAPQEWKLFQEAEEKYEYIELSSN